MKKTLLSAVAFIAMGSIALPAVSGETLNAVKKRGHVLCGVNTSAPGFASADSEGNWKGLDVNTCRAVAAAVLGDAEKVKYVPLSSSQRFTALQSREIDILSRNTTWTMTRDASQGAVFVAVSYYDGQGFIVPKEFGIKSAKELDGATICVQSGTSSEKTLADYFKTHKMQYQTVVFDTTEATQAAFLSGRDGATICVQSGTSSEKTLADYFKTHKMQYQTVVFDTTEATQAAFLSGRCQVYTTDMSDLAGMRTLAQDPSKYEILPELISKEPLGPAVARGDDEWFQIVRWSFYATVEAEELGVTKTNVDALKKNSTDPNIQRLLGVNEDMGKLIGLDKDWSYRIIKQVGNYGESWTEYFGPGTELNLPRGLNKLWTDGGLMYAQPIR